MAYYINLFSPETYFAFAESIGQFPDSAVTRDRRQWH